MELSNAVYDKLKFLVQIVLPGLAALYLGLAQQWDLPEPEKVAGTIAVLATFLGLFLVRSAAKYGGAGDLVVMTDPTDGEVYLSADLNKHPDAFKNKKNITLNVVQQDLPDAA